MSFVSSITSFWGKTLTFGKARIINKHERSIQSLSLTFFNLESSVVIRDPPEQQSSDCCSDKKKRLGKAALPGIVTYPI
jgi:hypothetical protein